MYNVPWHERQISCSELKDVFMAIYWVELYNSWEVMAGQSGYSEPVIAKRVKATATDLSGIKRLILFVFKKMRVTL